MEFKSMIEEFGVPLVSYQKREGHWAENGDWITDSKLVQGTITGVVLPFTDDDLKYAENGTYHARDRKIYVTQELKQGQKVVHRDIPYTIQYFRDFRDYSDVFIYIARWAGHESGST